MTDSYKGTFKQFEHLAKVYINGGISELEESLEAGDWSLFVVNRQILAEAELSKEDQEKLTEIDRAIANVFTPELLKK